MVDHLDSPARIIFVSSGTHDPLQKTGIPPPAYTSARELAFPQEKEDNEKENEEKEKGNKKSANDLMKEGQCRYSTSKLCNVLCTYEMVRRLKQKQQKEEEAKEDEKEEDEGIPNISVAAFDPGLMPGTGLAREYSAIAQLAWRYLLPIATLFGSNIHLPSTSGASLARLAVSEECSDLNNKYFEGQKEKRSSEESYDEEKAKDLWETSMELVGLKN